MNIELLNRKLTQMIEYLGELKRFENLTYDQYYLQRFAVERLIQLLVDTGVDLLARILKGKYKIKTRTYRDAFIIAADKRLITYELGEILAVFAALRNILVHQYEDVEPIAIQQQIEGCISSFSDFIRQIRDKI